MESLEHAIGAAIAELVWEGDPPHDDRWCGGEATMDEHTFDSTSFGEDVKKALDKKGLIVSWFEEPA